MKIMIVDDHAVLREGLKRILQDEVAQAEFMEAGSAGETLELLRQSPCDVLVLDIFLPDRSGLQVLQEVRNLHPRLPVLVLSSAPEEQIALHVLKAGANGYLNKQAAPEDLVGAVRKVLAGGRYLSPAMMDQFLAEVGTGNVLPHDKLSPREFEVMQLVVVGYSLKEIAARLSLSVKTISTFHTRLLEKLQLQNDVELVHYALANGLIEQEGPG